ncbi:hypothetical protein BDA99DRAFT_329362 [Phascolomyces articulosus]|uniref:RNI-like protein n=1 Tax=Phascolomyces articulosus TaxID=60185 RepID=A0AAD5KHM3_9FUNG|nr:hypothetical protein BDA99DRAFT_329362 [Phascolomyces articulosus]
MVKSQCLAALRRVQNTLTEFAIDGENVPTFEEILFNCPNLNKLVYSAQDNMQIGIRKNSQLPSLLHLTHLYLHISAEADLEYEELERVLRRCPEIRSLDIKRCTKMPLDLINRYCPNLENLGYGGRHTFFISTEFSWRSGWEKAWKEWWTKPKIKTTTFDDDDDDDEENNKVAQQDEGGKLRCVDLQIEQDQVDGKQIFRLLNGHRDELEIFSIFYISFGGAFPDPRWDPLLKFESQSLNELIFRFDGMTNILSSIVSKCPNIQVLDIGYIPGFTDRDIDIITRVPALRKFCIASNVKLSLNNIRRFVDGFKSRRDPLETLRLQASDTVTDDMLLELARLSRLTEIGMTHCSTITAAGLERFVQELPKMKALSYLYLDKMHMINDELLASLSKVNTVRCIELVGLDNITGTGIRSLALASKSLKHLKVLVCSHAVTKEDIEYCRTKIPSVTFHERHPSVTSMNYDNIDDIE